MKNIVRQCKSIILNVGPSLLDTGGMMSVTNF